MSFFKENGNQFAKFSEKANQQPIILKQVSSDYIKGAHYTKDELSLSVQGEKATFFDGKETHHWVLVSPLQYRYSNDKKSIWVTYFSKGDKRFVTIKESEGSEFTLEQTEAWAKGTEYGTDSTLQWYSQKNKGILTKVWCKNRIFN